MEGNTCLLGIKKYQGSLSSGIGDDLKSTSGFRFIDLDEPISINEVLTGIDSVAFEKWKKSPTGNYKIQFAFTIPNKFQEQYWKQEFWIYELVL